MLPVKDHGIYVLSSEGEIKGKRRTVACAEGYAPANFSDGGELHDVCVDAVGGEDFAKSLPLTDDVLTALAKGNMICSSSSLKLRSLLIWLRSGGRHEIRG